MEVAQYSQNELVAMYERAALLESCMKEYSGIAKEYDELKKKLYRAMSDNNIRQWVTNNGTKITCVAEKPAETVIEEVFDLKLFSSENPELHQKYMKEQPKLKSGRSGYVKITFKEPE